MNAILVTWVANSVAIYAVAWLMRGVAVASVKDAVIAGAILSVINAVVKPVLVVLTLPLTIVTLGLFYFLVTAFCLWLTTVFVPGFMLQGFLTTIVAAVLVSLLSAVIHRALADAGSRGRRR